METVLDSVVKNNRVQGQHRVPNLWEDPSTLDLALIFCSMYCHILHICVYKLRALVSDSFPFTTQSELKYAFTKMPGYIYSLVSQIALFSKGRSTERRVQYTLSSQLNIFENSSLVRQFNLNFQRNSE